MTDKTREDFEAWARREKHDVSPFLANPAIYDCNYTQVLWEGYQAATQQSAARIVALEAERADFRDASKVNFENYEFQRRKADAATASVYQFHYAMKDAGWHPGRTDDNLCDIIRAKGAELAKLEAEVLALRKDAERLDWLEKNLFSREPDDWDSKYGICKGGKNWMWAVFAPSGVRGGARRIIDSAIEAERGEG